MSTNDNIKIETILTGTNDFDVNRDAKRVTFRTHYDICADGKKVGYVEALRTYEAVMNEEYDEDDYHCSDHPEDYVDYDFDYIREGELIDTYIEAIQIDEEWRGKGIGTKVLTEEFMGAYLAPDNEDAKRLYERIGRDAGHTDFGWYDQGLGVYQIW